MPPWLLSALGFLKRAPWQAWAAIVLVAALLVQTARIEGFKVWPVSIDGYKAELAAAKGELAARAAVAAQWTADMTTLAEQFRSKNHETNTRIVERAGAIGMRGPGKATCPYSAPSAASGSEARSGQADAGLGGLSDQTGTALAAVPFNELVERAKVCDLNRQEVIDRRAYDAALADWWAKASK